jgi:hypothetical protein
MPSDDTAAATNAVLFCDSQLLKVAVAYVSTWTAPPKPPVFKLLRNVHCKNVTVVPEGMGTGTSLAAIDWGETPMTRTHAPTGNPKGLLVLVGASLELLAKTEADTLVV